MKSKINRRLILNLGLTNLTINLPEKSKANNPALRALTEIKVKTVNITGKMTADLNFNANKIGNKSFLNLEERETETIKIK